MLYITRLYCMYLGSAVCVILQTSQYYWKVLRPTCNGPAERGGGKGGGGGGDDEGMLFDWVEICTTATIPLLLKLFLHPQDPKFDFAIPHQAVIYCATV